MENIKGVAIGTFISNQIRHVRLIPFTEEKELDEWKKTMNSKVVIMERLNKSEIKFLDALYDVPFIREILEKIIDAAIQIGREEREKE